MCSLIDALIDRVVTCSATQPHHPLSGGYIHSCMLEDPTKQELLLFWSPE